MNPFHTPHTLTALCLWHRVAKLLDTLKSNQTERVVSVDAYYPGTTRGSQYTPGVRTRFHPCHGCSGVNEPHCAVHAAIELAALRPAD